VNYLKSPEQVVEYTPRGDIDPGKELAFSRVASALIDRYCERSLSIRYYLLDFELNQAMVGYIPKRPVIQLAPTTLATGIRIRPMGRRYDGSREELGSWQDVADTTNAANSIYNPQTGRFELFYSGLNDYYRLLYSLEFYRGWANRAYWWQAQIEVYAGFLLDTTLAVPAIHSSSQVQLVSVVGAVPGKTKINLGANLTEYTITAVNTVTNLVEVTPAIPGTLAAGTEVTQVVPEDIKIAAGMIIEDRTLYQPNTERQTEVLDVLTDRLSRMGRNPVPVDAQQLLGAYRNFL
jgi:hypothetical protein